MADTTGKTAVIMGNHSLQNHSEPDLRIRLFQDSLLKWASTQMPNWLRSHLDPADLVQQTLTEYLNQKPISQPLEDHQLLRYLRRSLTNNLIDATRKFKNFRSEVSTEVLADSSVRMCHWLAAPDTSPSERFERNEKYERICHILAKLPDAQRIAVEMRYFQKARLSEISAVLNRSEGSIAALLYRAITTFRNEFGFDDSLN